MRPGTNIIMAFVVAIAAASESHAQSEPHEAPEKDVESKADGAGAGVASALVQTLGIPTSGVELGLGWDSKKGRVVPNRCVDFAPVQERGQGVTLDMHEVSDQSEVMESLGVSASVSVRTLFVSGSAQASFAKQAKVNATSTSLMLRAIVDDGVLFAGPRRWQERARFSYPTIPEDGEAPPASGWKDWAKDRSGQDRYIVGLKPWASDILTPAQSEDETSGASGVQAFRRHCGDSYVSAIYSGAELLAMITFRASSREDKRTITASLKAQFGPVEMSASAAEKRNKKREDTDLEVSYMQIGGGSGIIPTTHEDLVQKLKALPAEAAREPKFRAMEVTPYTNLPEWRWDTSSSSVDADNEPYADFYWFLTSFDDDIEAVLQEPGDFSFRSGCILPELRRLQDDLLDVRRTIRVGVHGLQTDTVPSKPSDAKGAVPPELSDARYAFFGPRDLDLSVLGTVPKDSGSGSEADATAYGAFATELTGSMPEGNPNVLRLYLPLPTAGAAAAEGVGKRDYLRLVIDHYIRPQAKRMCALEPTDNECLSNAEMEELTEYIPYNETTGPDRASMLIQSVADGSCLYLPAEKEESDPLLTGDCADDALVDNQGTFVHEKKEQTLQLLAAQNCVGVTGDQVTHGTDCKESNWEFTPEGLIKNDGQCITTQGPGQEAVVTTCSSSAAGDQTGGDETAEDETGEDETARVTQRWRIVPADDDSLRKLTEACSFRLGA